ncbi:putative FAD-dependent oxidoreductase [compost metagenome]
MGWPTKLALAPDLADRVQKNLDLAGIHPASASTLPELPRPPLARPVWEELLP